MHVLSFRWFFHLGPVHRLAMMIIVPQRNGFDSQLKLSIVGKSELLHLLEGPEFSTHNWEDREEKKAQHPVGFKPTTSLLQGVCLMLCYNQCPRFCLRLKTKGCGNPYLVSRQPPGGSSPETGPKKRAPWSPASVSPELWPVSSFAEPCSTSSTRTEAVGRTSSCESPFVNRDTGFESRRPL